MESSASVAAAKTWAQRAQAELGAETRFKVLTTQLIDAKASHKIVTTAIKAIEDENRHAKMCSKVAQDMGHKTGFELFRGLKTNLVKPWENGSSFEDQLLCEIVLMCCITETINASLLNSIYSQSKDTPAKKVIQEILKDEVKHSQLGWAYLASEVKKRDCTFLGKHLSFMLEISVKDELFAPAPIVNDLNSMDYGVLPVSFRLEQFTETLKSIVLPGLIEFGIPTHQAIDWLEKKSIKKASAMPAF